MAPYLDTPSADEEGNEQWPMKDRDIFESQDEGCVTAIGGHDQWLFDNSSETFDLSRGSLRTLTMHGGREYMRSQHHRGVTINPEKACLVIVDMQNYFVHPSFHTHLAGNEAVKPLLSVIQKCRDEGIQVAWLNWVINERDMLSTPPAVQRSFNAARIQERGHGWGVNLGSPVPEHLGGSRVLWEGSWNADIHQPLKHAVSPTDVICHKNRMSGLWCDSEPLHQYLRDGAFQTLLFAGINTDQCLLGTMTDAYSWGWDVIMLRDCTGTATRVPGAQELVEYNVATCMGFVLDSDALIGSTTSSRRAELTRNDSGIDL